ncbi:beta-1,4-glucuronyltransferase 1-like isoform X2 [Periplaneta americana]|uniref:beta-1,4-glucuronyltransferase 1-like isoform X2 n=1 Tax=Periplaneta americana TaxID=6978 RepID=UPI0037E776A7
MWLSRCRLWRWLLACFIILLIANIWFVPWTKITKHGKVTNSYEQQLQATRKARSFQDIQREKYDTIVHRNTSESNKKSIRSSADDFSKEFEINIKLGRWDSNQRFKYFDFVVIGDRFEELSDMYSVSLATQSSLERLYSLAEVSHHWTAAISVSVFIVGEDFFLTEIYISYLRQCFTEVRERVTFHLAYSSEYPAASDYPSLVVNRTQNCSHPKQVLSELVALRSPETVDWLNSYEYPQNHLRNHARKNCQTPYVFLTDVDIIPSTGMADALDIFLTQQNHTNLCAYVIPAYELHDSVTFPENKSEILQIIEKGLARPFRRMVYKNGHFPTNYEKYTKCWPPAISSKSCRLYSPATGASQSKASVTQTQE